MDLKARDTWQWRLTLRACYSVKHRNSNLHKTDFLLKMMDFLLKTMDFLLHKMKLTLSRE